MVVGNRKYQIPNSDWSEKQDFSLSLVVSQALISMILGSNSGVSNYRIVENSVAVSISYNGNHYTTTKIAATYYWFLLMIHIPMCREVQSWTVFKAENFKDLNFKSALLNKEI